MKKNILIALVALVVVALNVKAQNNTYNMVIEMANGTKITIGPNDVRNISFNNGELVMTGEDINTLVEQQNKTDMRIDSLAMTDLAHFDEAIEKTDALMDYCKYLDYGMAKTSAELENLQNYIDESIGSIQGGGTPDLSNYVTYTFVENELIPWIFKLNSRIDDLQLEIDTLKAKLE